MVTVIGKGVVHAGMAVFCPVSNGCKYMFVRVAHALGRRHLVDAEMGTHVSITTTTCRALDRSVLIEVRKSNVIDEAILVHSDRDKLCLGRNVGVGIPTHIMCLFAVPCIVAFVAERGISQG